MTWMRRWAASVAVAALAGCRTAMTHREAAGAMGPYSGSVESGGLVFVSGAICRGPAPGGAFAGEAHAAIGALEQALARAGLSLRDVVSVTVYLTDLDLYGELNAVYAERFHAPYPARACVEVSGLPGGARVEIQAIARR